MKIINFKKENDIKKIQYLIDKRNLDNFDNTKINKKVQSIINDVKREGDKALFKYSKKYDKIILNKNNLRILEKKIKYDYKIDKKIINSFKLAIKNVRYFHKKQFPKNYNINSNNIKIGSVWKALDSVGLYVPGGHAVYPSSLIMNVIPAQIAGVKRIVVVTPGKEGKIDPIILTLLNLLNIKEVYQIGGAQAIAALAYGTETIKPVNKIFGPGNAYVATAKKKLFGKVGIDLIAGPSEIVVVADQYNKAEWVAADLIAQSEHDEKSQAILITDSLKFAKKVIEKINLFTTKLPKRRIIKKSLSKYGAIIIINDLNLSPKLINMIAPEHLHLQNKTKNHIFKNINNFGTVFLGEFTSESFGDYIVGTNHILPTSGSAKFSSGLGVLDFMKRSSYVNMNEKSYKKLASHVVNLASVENLDGHKMSVIIRQKQKK